MRTHWLQHVPFEGLGSIEPWFREKGDEITVTRFFEPRWSFPNPRDVNFLIVMGGPMSVGDKKANPWLIDEERFIRDLIKAGKPVLGVCLGAQLIASAMGARVFPNRTKEIGWFPVRGVSNAQNDLFRFPNAFDAFHWHGDTFDLPPTAVRLAESEGCRNQAFQVGRSVIGLQFHLETTPESARAIVHHCRTDLFPKQYVQAESDILAAPTTRYRAINRLLADVLSYLR